MCGARGGGRIGCSEIDGDMEKEGGSANSGVRIYSAFGWRMRVEDM